MQKRGKLNNFRTVFEEKKVETKTETEKTQTNYISSTSDKTSAPPIFLLHSTKIIEHNGFLLRKHQNFVCLSVRRRKKNIPYYEILI